MAEPKPYGMQRALTFAYVKQLPRTTADEVGDQEAVYDRQVLLNESWESYCERQGTPERASEGGQRDKWVTETWPEWEERKRRQPETIDRFFGGLQAAHDAGAAAKRTRAEQSEKVLRQIRDAEERRAKKLLPVLHTLLLDFEEKRQREDALVRGALEADEASARETAHRDEHAAFALLATAFSDGVGDITEMLKVRGEMEEEARIAREKEEERLEAERKVALEREMEEKKRREQEAAEEERRRVQEEKDRKAAERKARVMADREKRKSKEELAASKRDSRRRSSAREVADPSSRHLKRDGSRSARVERQSNDMDAYLRALEPRVAAIDTEDSLQALLRTVAMELGELLFDCAVYISVLDTDTLLYKYASANCSAVLQTGAERLDTRAHPNCPTVQAMKYKETVCLTDPLVSPGWEDIVRVGTKEEGGKGDFAVVPILDASGEVAAVLAADTIQALNAKQTNFVEGEEDCYSGDPLAVSLSIPVVSFLEQVSTLLSKAYVTGTLPSVEDANSVAELYNTVTNAIAGFRPDMNCYIATLTRPHGSVFTVLSQNGISSASEAPQNFGAHGNVIGKTITEGDSVPSFNLTPSKGSYDFVENVKECEGAACYAGPDTAKRNDFLYLFPISVRYKGADVVIGTVGVEGDATRPLTESQILQISTLVEQLSDRREPLMKLRMQQLYAAQCIQWCAALSGCRHVYLSLRQSLVEFGPASTSRTDTFQYVSATPAQQWVVGKMVEEGEGITAAIIDGKQSKHYPDVRKEERIKLLDRAKVPGEAEGQLAVAPIGTRGALYMDTVGWTEGKRNLSPADLEMMTNAASLLDKLCSDLAEGNVDEVGADEMRLKLEDDVNPSCVRFLKRIWLDTIASLLAMTKQELLEMARYNKPPEAIPPVCSAAFIVLGRKPKSVATWDQCRRSIKYTLIARMTTFDPTGSKPAKAFFIRAKKMTKGCTVDFVAKKGSKPASLFFRWTYVNIQMRYAAIKFRKMHAEGLLELDEVAPIDDDDAATESSSVFSETGDSTTVDEEDEDGEGEEEREEADADDPEQAEEEAAEDAEGDE
ncbi:hypothetical protein DIPPA_10707 [Diplonema papillatum]|nr:hypothetical protein DIPPA_10707 [Diplonema papillatum]|eukprot:gene1632-2441_t